MKNAMTELVDKERKDKKLMTESLLLPCTAVGKTTSASIAERSNVWAENKLVERKTALDQKLYRNVIKINSDKLQVAEELVKIRKSASTSALDRMAKKMGKDVDSSELNRSFNYSPGRERQHKTNNSPTLLRRSGQHHEKANRKSTSPNSNDSGIIIRVTSVSDSEDNSDHSDVGDRGVGDPEGEMAAETDKKAKRIISVTSCPTGRVCSTDRSELHKFENATKRFTKQLQGQRKGGK